MVDFLDPDSGTPEEGEQGDFWRINEHVGETMLLVPQDEHMEKTDYGDNRVIDCIGGVWSNRESRFYITGNVRIFQGVLKKKLRSALAQGAAVVATLVKNAAYYDFVLVDPTLKKQMAEAWERLQGESDQPADDTF